MENVLNKLAEVKKDLIQYIIESAETNKLSYLYTSYCDVDKVNLYHISIDNKYFITEDIIYRLNSFNIELLAKFCAKVKQDLNKVMWADNGHDYKLVNKINECYHKNKASFLKILQFIAQRDSIEVEELYLNNINVNEINVYEIKHIELYATELLTHICDDKDLECIIAYCRM